MVGFVFVGIALIGWFISRKMFDIRRAQLNYVKVMNAIRERAYEVLGIAERYELTPFGRGADVKKGSKSKEDFGRDMQWPHRFRQEKSCR